MPLNLGKFVHTETGKYVMSILLGMGLATLFRRACDHQNCLQFRAPPLKEIQDKVFRSSDHPDKCVTYEPVATKCSINAKKIDFE